MNDQHSPLHDPHAPAQPAAALPDRTIDRDYCLAVEAERDFLRERNKKLEARHKEDVRLLDRLSEAEGRYLKAEAQLEQYQKAEQDSMLASKDPKCVFVKLPAEPTIEIIAELWFNGDVELAVGHAAISEDHAEAYRALIRRAKALMPESPACHSLQPTLGTT